MNRCPAQRITEREESACSNRSSTLRSRSIVDALSVRLFGKSLAVADFPSSPHLVGIGMSDGEVYASRLGGKLSYTNTFFHQPPHLDITRIDGSERGKYDFIISSDQ
jgi:hypothetical protein